MTRTGRRLSIVIACLVTCAITTPVLRRELWPDVRTEDRNGDGRPDIWRTYDRQSQLASVAVDSNFDGRSDIQEYYEAGVLVRRESDRDFDDRVDLVQEFDVRTHQRVRSVEDVDFDGSADVLGLFHDGRLVYQKWTRAAASSSFPSRYAGGDARLRTADQRLAPFADPFRSDLALRAVHRPADFGGGIGLSTSGGLPAAAFGVATPLPSSIVAGDSALPFGAESATGHAPRGPPRSTLLA